MIKAVFFSTADVTARTHVAVIGSDIAKSLYGDSDPIGQDLKINNQIFSVVGIFDSESKSSLNETVIIPYKSARLILNSTDVGTYTFVCKDGFESDRAVNQAESYMGKVFSDNSKYSIKSNYNSGMVSRNSAYCSYSFSYYTNYKLLQFGHVCRLSFKNHKKLI